MHKASTTAAREKDALSCSVEVASKVDPVYSFMQEDFHMNSMSN